MLILFTELDGGKVFVVEALLRCNAAMLVNSAAAASLWLLVLIMMMMMRTSNVLGGRCSSDAMERLNEFVLQKSADLTEGRQTEQRYINGNI